MPSPPSPPSQSTIAGGAPIALAVLAGTIIGLIVRQPTIGFLVGLAIGVVIAVVIWRLNR